MSHALHIVCPFCWARHRVASSVGDIKPSQGDYLICSRCGQTAILDGIARKPSHDEKLAMRAHKGLQNLRNWWLNSLATVGTQ